MISVLHLLALLLFPPLLLGVVAKTKALFAGRTGPPLLQPYFDLARLLRKGAVYSRTATWVFRAGPIVSLACVVAAGLLIPLAAFPAPLSFAGDIVLFAYLLGLGRFFTVLAALDTGSSFEGMGASREVTFAALAEPALILALVILGLQGGTMVLAEALQPYFRTAWIETLPLNFCLFLALAVVLLAENSRMPVDDPNTHLELTMIHEVMVLDHGGVDLAFVTYGAAVKFFLSAVLMVRALLPLSEPQWQALPAVLLGSIVVAVGVGCVESVTARFRLSRVPQFVLGASALGIVSLCLLYWRGLA